MMIRAISLWQPWAQWVVAGHKPIETRLHQRFKGLVGERIAIHAAFKWDTEAYESARRALGFALLPLFLQVQRIAPGIVGTVNVEQFRSLGSFDTPAALIDCGTIQRYGLCLSKPKSFQPFNWRGGQGIFWVNAPDSFFE